MIFKGFAAASMAAVALAATSTLPANAQQQRVQIGQLACSISAGVGLILGSQRNVSCNFQPDGAPPEAYVGTMTIIGVDIGFTSGSAMVWGVFAGTTRYAGMLSGTYVGAAPPATGPEPPSPALAPMRWLADRTVRWRCSRSRSRARSGSMRPAASARSNCISRNNLRRASAAPPQRVAGCDDAPLDRPRRRLKRLPPPFPPPPQAGE